MRNFYRLRKSIWHCKSQYTTWKNKSLCYKNNLKWSQGAVLGHLLFLIFINDLSIAIKKSEFFHFTDDTCLLNIKDSIKKINKVVNKDLKFLIQWVHENKVSLNVAKTEVIIFTRTKKQLDFDLKLKICGKKLQASSYVNEYLD